MESEPLTQELAGSVGDLTHEITKTVATTAIGLYSLPVSFRGLGPSSESMAYYGMPSTGQALSASTNNDKITIKDLGGTLITAQSVYGGEGNDVIALGAAGITATASANINAPTFATGAAKVVTGEVVLYGSAGTTYSDLSSFSYTTNGTGGSIAVSAAGVRTSDAGARTVSQALFQANAGNDSISLGDSLTTVTASTFAGGAGNDLIGSYTYVNEEWTEARVSATFVNTRFEGGNGNDTINLRGDAVYSAMNLNANKGSDSVIFNGSISGTTNSVIGLGAGNDALTGDFVTISTSTIAGGKGNDVITMSATTMDKVVIGLDRANASNTDGDGNDSFNFYGGTTFTGSTIYGGGGNDSVTYSANGMTASVVSLNDGADIFSAEKETIIKDSTVGLGKGGDQFHVVDSGRILSSRINLGKGADTTDFGGHDIGSSTDFNTTLYGGAGADLLLGSAVSEAGDTVQVQLGYTDNSESTLSAFDTVDFNVNGTGTYQFRYDPGATRASFDGSGLSGTNGLVTFSSTFATDVTARVNAIASNASNGEAAAFLDGDSKAYLFVKGSSDNLVVQIGSAASNALETLTISASKNIHLKID